MTGKGRDSIMGHVGNVGSVGNNMSNRCKSSSTKEQKMDPTPKSRRHIIPIHGYLQSYVRPEWEAQAWCQLFCTTRTLERGCTPC